MRPQRASRLPDGPLEEIMSKRRDETIGWAVRAGGAVLAIAGVLLPIAAGLASAAGPGAIRSLAVDPRGDVLFIATESGLHQSRDRGKTLTPLPLPAAQGKKVTAVVLDWASGGAVYAGTDGAGVLRSRDGGQSWAAANKGLDSLQVVGLALDPRARQKLHAMIRDKGLFRTVDSGESWERVADGPAGIVHVLASVNISTGMGGIFLYAGTDQGLVHGPD